MPAAAMLEASRAAAQLLIDDSKASSGSSSGGAALLAASIPAPLILPAGGSSSHAAAASIPAVRCTVIFGSSSSLAAVQLQSMSSSGSSAPATNLAAQLCSHTHLSALGSAPAVASGSSGALRLILGSSVAARASPLTAFGSLLLEQQHCAPGYHCHPAALDATLHLGIFAAPDQQQGSGSPAPPRVPVAAGYYNAPSQGSTTVSASWPVMQCDSATADATTASYALLSGARTSSNGFQLQHLQSKSIRSRAAAAAAGGKADSVPELASYRVQYAVHSLAGPAASIATGRRHPVASLASSAGRLSLRQQQSSSGAAVFGGAQEALRFLQQQHSKTLQLTAATGSLHHTAPGATGGQALSNTLLAATVIGMLKSASAEASATAALPGSLTYSHLHPAASPAGAAPESDVFVAAHLQHGAWLTPVLMEDPQPAAAALTPALPALLQQLASGSIAISGGMGSLGLLIATWLAASRADCSAGSGGITLWGRSAAAPLPGGLASSSCLVTASHCDAAACADIGAAADSQRRTAAYIHAGELPVGGAACLLPACCLPAACLLPACLPAAACALRWRCQICLCCYSGMCIVCPTLNLLHLLLPAGGVLQDALLPKQGAGSLRAALAPKLSGAINAAAALRLQPLAQHLLFSSVASLLGNAGQANYSAANAALDAAAQLLQQGGTSAISLQWGPWSGGGMATAAVAASLAAKGVGLVQPASGLQLLQRVLAGSNGIAAAAMVAPLVVLDWRLMLRPAQQSSPFFADMAPAATSTARLSAAGTAPAQHQRAAGAALSVQQVQEQLQELVAGVVGCTIDPAVAFMSAGLDSLGEAYRLLVVLTTPLARHGTQYAIAACWPP